MSKLIDRAKRSKLNIQKEEVKSERLTSVSRAAYSQVRSFRLDDASWNNLTIMLEKTNLHSSRKVSASRLVKALIHLGQKASEEQLVKALKEVAI